MRLINTSVNMQDHHVLNEAALMLNRYVYDLETQMGDTASPELKRAFDEVWTVQEKLDRLAEAAREEAKIAA